MAIIITTKNKILICITVMGIIIIVILITLKLYWDHSKPDNSNDEDENSESLSQEKSSKWERLFRESETERIEFQETTDEDTFYSTNLEFSQTKNTVKTTEKEIILNSKTIDKDIFKFSQTKNKKEKNTKKATTKNFKNVKNGQINEKSNQMIHSNSKIINEKTSSFICNSCSSNKNRTETLKDKTTDISQNIRNNEPHEESSQSIYFEPQIIDEEIFRLKVIELSLDENNCDEIEDKTTKFNSQNIANEEIKDDSIQESSGSFWSRTKDYLYSWCTSFLCWKDTKETPEKETMNEA